MSTWYYKLNKAEEAHARWYGNSIHEYAVSHGLEPGTEPYAGMAELYFPDASGWASYREHIQPDGMEQWVDYDAMRIFQSGTEMVGIA